MSIQINNAVRFVLPVAGEPGGNGGGEAWSPADLTSLTHWYDPSDATTVTLDGSAVDQLADKSGNGYHASSVATPPIPLIGV